MLLTSETSWKNNAYEIGNQVEQKHEFSNQKYNIKLITKFHSVKVIAVLPLKI